MKRALLCVLFMAGSGAILLARVPLRAQETGEAPPPKNGLEDAVQGVFVAPLKGAPFSATVEIKEQILNADGTIATSYTINEIARDDAGRIHNETRRAMPEGFKGIPEILEVHIFDPQTGVSICYIPRTRMASRRVLLQPPNDLNARLLAVHNPESRDLGTITLSGLHCRGTRNTYTLPASGNAGAPVTVSDELWYSEDLHINLLASHTLSRGGGHTVAVTRINREPPDPALFEVPEGYKIVDVTPPPSTLVRKSQPR